MSAAASVVAGGRSFGRWWARELAQLFPPRWRLALRAAGLPPMVRVAGEGFEVHFFRGGEWRKEATVEPAAPGADLSRELAQALERSPAFRRGAREVLLSLPDEAYLRRTLRLPAAVEENLRGVARFELDRFTPFGADQALFDCYVGRRDLAARELEIELFVAPRPAVEAQRRRVEANGLRVTGVVPGLRPVETLIVNLLRDEVQPTLRWYLRAEFWLPALVLAGLLALAVGLPIWQKRERAIALLEPVAMAQRAAQGAEAVRTELERLQAQHNFLLARKHGYPTTLQLLDEVARLLPDDTWVQVLEMRNANKQRELQLQGETGSSGRLITLFEGSKLLAGATFKSPLVKQPNSPADRFHLVMEVRPSPPPPAQPAAPAGESAPADGEAAAADGEAAPADGEAAAATGAKP